MRQRGHLRAEYGRMRADWSVQRGRRNVVGGANVTTGRTLTTPHAVADVIRVVKIAGDVVRVVRQTNHAVAQIMGGASSQWTSDFVTAETI